MKQCKKCKQNKNLNNFYFHMGMRDKRLNICKKCKLNYANKKSKEIKGKCVNCKKEIYTSRFKKKIGQGRFCSQKCSSLFLNLKPPINYGVNCWNYKGDKVGYDALHDWVKRELGTPLRCEHCGKNNLTKQKIHWANKSRKYIRVIDDWIRLCVSCHRKYDKNLC